MTSGRYTLLLVELVLAFILEENERWCCNPIPVRSKSGDISAQWRGPFFLLPKERKKSDKTRPSSIAIDMQKQIHINLHRCFNFPFSEFAATYPSAFTPQYSPIPGKL
ncbi:hypothetical protein SLA2020_079340 [Shorea laevis]